MRFGTSWLIYWNFGSYRVNNDVKYIKLFMLLLHEKGLSKHEDKRGKIGASRTLDHENASENESCHYFELVRHSLRVMQSLVFSTLSTPLTLC